MVGGSLERAKHQAEKPWQARKHCQYSPDTWPHQVTQGSYPGAIFGGLLLSSNTTKQHFIIIINPFMLHPLVYSLKIMSKDLFYNSIINPDNWAVFNLQNYQIRDGHDMAFSLAVLSSNPGQIFVCFSSWHTQDIIRKYVIDCGCPR